MKKFKFFDIYQIVITILFGVGIAGSFISNLSATFFVAINMTFDAYNNPVLPEIPLSFSIAYTFFLLIAIMFGVWFFIRLITFKNRKKEFLDDETI